MPPVAERTLQGTAFQRTFELDFRGEL